MYFMPSDKGGAEGRGYISSLQLQLIFFRKSVEEDLEFFFTT